MNTRKENANAYPQAVSSAIVELSDTELGQVVGGCDDRRDHNWHERRHHSCSGHHDPRHHGHEHGLIGHLLPHF